MLLDERPGRLETVVIRVRSDVVTSLTVEAFKHGLERDALIEAALQWFVSLSVSERTKVIARALRRL